VSCGNEGFPDVCPFDYDREALPSDLDPPARSIHRMSVCRLVLREVDQIIALNVRHPGLFLTIRVAWREPVSLLRENETPTLLRLGQQFDDNAMVKGLPSTAAVFRITHHRVAREQESFALPIPVRRRRSARPGAVSTATNARDRTNLIGQSRQKSLKRSGASSV
jgi:hypothetical protein